MGVQNLLGALLEEPSPVSKTEIPETCLYAVVCQLECTKQHNCLFWLENSINSHSLTLKMATSLYGFKYIFFYIGKCREFIGVGIKLHEILGS